VSEIMIDLMVRLFMGTGSAIISFPFLFLFFGIFFGWEAGFTFAYKMSLMNIFLWVLFARDKRYSN